jgi:hypothetical protein
VGGRQPRASSSLGTFRQSPPTRARPSSNEIRALWVTYSSHLRPCSSYFVQARPVGRSKLPAFSNHLAAAFFKAIQVDARELGGDLAAARDHLWSGSKVEGRGKLSRGGSAAWSMMRRSIYGRMQMAWTAIREWRRKRTLRAMLNDPRSARGFRSTGQLQKGIGADRSTTERLLLAIGARKSDVAEEWTLNPL